MCRLSLLLLLACVLISAGCEHPDNAASRRPVHTRQAVSSQSFSQEFFTGKILGHVSTNASFKIAGNMAERFVAVGDHVTAGQKLAKLDDSTFRDQLDAAQAKVRADQALVAQAHAKAARAASLVQMQAVSRNEYDDSVRQEKDASEQLKADMATLNSVREQLGYTILTANITGIITDRLAEAGENVSAGQTIFTISSKDTPDAVFELPEKMILSGIAKGQHIEICSERQKTLCTQGKIYEISPQADSTRTYQVKAALSLLPETMLLGSTITGNFVIHEGMTYAIPASALTSHGSTPAVWVVGKDSKIEYRDVEIVRYEADRVIVRGGLCAGDSFVTDGVQTLLDRQFIREITDEQN